MQQVKIHRLANGPLLQVLQLVLGVDHHLLFVEIELFKGYLWLKEVGIANAPNDTHHAIAGNGIAWSILRERRAQWIRRIRHRCQRIVVGRCRIDVKLNDIHWHIGIRCKSVRCPIGNESGSQWFNEFHFKECQLIRALGLLVRLRIILNAKFQFGVAVLIHLPRLGNHIPKRHATENGTRQQNLELPPQLVAYRFFAFVVEGLVGRASLIAQPVEGANRRVVGLSLYPIVIA